MSQSHHVESDHRGELDPLLAFNAEITTAEPPQTPVDPQPSAADDQSAVRARLDQAERSLDRARIEIASLKSDLATLVTAVDDIKKRLSRRPEVIAAPPPAKVPQRNGLGRATMLVILGVTIGVAIWGAASVAWVEIPDPPPVNTESTAAVPIPPPIELQAAASVDPPPPLHSARESAGAAQDSPVQQAAMRQPAAYVGTLSIDAEPAGDVFINRRGAGRTPVRAENLRAGSHLIWIEREGYRRWTRVVAVAADRVTRVSANLDPLVR